MKLKSILIVDRSSAPRGTRTANGAPFSGTSAEHPTETIYVVGHSEAGIDALRASRVAEKSGKLCGF